MKAHTAVFLILTFLVLSVAGGPWPSPKLEKKINRCGANNTRCKNANGRLKGGSAPFYSRVAQGDGITRVSRREYYKVNTDSITDSIPFKSGLRNPLGILPLYLVGASLSFWLGLRAYGAFLYPHTQPYRFLNATTREHRTMDILCGCDPYALCACDDNYSSVFLSAVIQSGLVQVGTVNNTMTLLLNGTVPRNKSRDNAELQSTTKRFANCLPELAAANSSSTNDDRGILSADDMASIILAALALPPAYISAWFAWLRHPAPARR
ncbi:hypothetical protein DL771_008293 [Monosporascus sp. 5C6A]|nr:hypothetical protein DL771_008293 [Monosporascus sp. 5C6A]